MIVEQWNLTAFHFLYVLIIHLSGNLYLLAVQLEIGRIQELKGLSKELSYYLVSSYIFEKLLGGVIVPAFPFPFHYCGILSPDHISIYGSMPPPQRKLNAGIFCTHILKVQWLSVIVCKMQGITTLILTSKSIVLIFMCWNEKPPLQTLGFEAAFFVTLFLIYLHFWAGKRILFISLMSSDKVIRWSELLALWVGEQPVCWYCWLCCKWIEDRKVIFKNVFRKKNRELCQMAAAK